MRLQVMAKQRFPGMVADWLTPLMTPNSMRRTFDEARFRHPSDPV
jgi:hypothetical protein